MVTKIWSAFYKESGSAFYNESGSESGSESSPRFITYRFAHLAVCWVIKQHMSQDWNSTTIWPGETNWCVCVLGLEKLHHPDGDCNPIVTWVWNAGKLTKSATKCHTSQITMMQTSHQINHSRSVTPDQSLSSSATKIVTVHFPLEE